MRVTFTKTGLRRYGVLVDRERAPQVGINPAPGYHEAVPHDLLHFLAEAEWRLDGAVFGQLACGGDAGMFVPTDEKLIPRAMRDRKRAKRRAGKPKGRRSEILADILERGWEARHGQGQLPENWEEYLAVARVTPGRLEQVLDRLDGLADRWQSLHVGEGITLDWPRPERRGVR